MKKICFWVVFGIMFGVVLEYLYGVLAPVHWPAVAGLRQIAEDLPGRFWLTWFVAFILLYAYAVATMLYGERLRYIAKRRGLKRFMRKLDSLPPEAFEVDEDGEVFVDEIAAEEMRERAGETAAENKKAGTKNAAANRG